MFWCVSSSELTHEEIFVPNCHLEGTGTSCKEKFPKENFQTGFLVVGGGFPSYCNHQLIKFEEEKRFGL